jgi:acyl-CoA thioester hydrolase
VSSGFVAPAVIAESQLAAFHIDEQRLVRLSSHHQEFLRRWLR